MSAPGEADETELRPAPAKTSACQEELRITMETMSRMLNEYSTMFSGAPPETAARRPPNVGPAPPDDAKCQPTLGSGR